MVLRTGGWPPLLQLQFSGSQTNQGHAANPTGAVLGPCRQLWGMATMWELTVLLWSPEGCRREGGDSCRLGSGLSWTLIYSLQIF